jgi:3-hydroxyacyl-[acyl-carrier-protein] dehydratase
MTRVETRFRIPVRHPSLQGHFPGNPIVPGVLLLDRVLWLLQREVGVRVTQLQQIKFTSALRPEEEAQVLCEVRGRHASFRVVACRDGVAVPVASGTLSVQPCGGPAQ